MVEWTKDNSKWSQEGSMLAKMDPKWSSYGARWPKEVAKIARNDSKWTQDISKWSQEGSMLANMDPKWSHIAQDGPERLQDCSKLFRDGTRRFQEGPQHGHRCAALLKLVSRARLREVPEMAKMGIRWSRYSPR